MRIRILSGLNAGHVFTSRGKFPSKTVFDHFALRDEQWELEEASACSPEELLAWKLASEAGRIRRALYNGRPIYLNGQEFRAPTFADVPTVHARLMTAIRACGRQEIGLISDGPDGVVLGVRPPAPAGGAEEN